MFVIMESSDLQVTYLWLTNLMMLEGGMLLSTKVMNPITAVVIIQKSMAVKSTTRIVIVKN